MLRKFLAIMLLLVFSFTLLGCNDSNKTDQVIAIVNNTEITQKQFDQYYTMVKTGYESQAGKSLDEKEDKDLIQNLKDRTFEDLILQTVVRQDAAQRNIVITNEQVEEDVKAFKQRYSDEDYANLLKQMSMTEADLKEQIELENLFIMLQDEVTNNVAVSDEEVETFYNENKDLFIEPAGMEIFHILVATEEEAQDILAKLNQGEDFSKLAGEFSTCPSKDQGGNLGLVNEESSLVEEFKVAALELKPGEITKAPVKSEFGYHIIKAGDYKEEKTFALEEVKAEVAGQLEINKQSEVFNTYLQELKDKAKVEDKRKK